MIQKIEFSDNETVQTVNVCPFHVANPGIVYAGCSCSSSYTLKRKTKRDANKKKGA